MIDKSTIDRIFSAADIVEVVGDFVTLKKKGVNYTACCPFHQEKTPSFIVSPAKGLYKCFGCGKGGGAVNFVMEHEKLTYPEALRWIARKYGIQIEEKTLTSEDLERNNDRESMLILNSWADTFFADQLKNNQVGRDVGLSYFYERGFTDATIDKFSLGYCPEGTSRDVMSRQAVREGYQEKFLVSTGLTIIREEDHSYYDRFSGRVMFPIHSLTGRVIGFGGRTMRTDKKSAKYLNSPQSEIYDKSHTLYGIFQAKKAITTAGKCILVEGYTDVIQMHQSGVENVVASSGTSLTEHQVRLIKRFTTNVTVIYDGDSAGIKASLRGIDMILKEGMTVRVVPLPEGEDPDSFARAHSATELESYIERNEEDFLKFKTRILLEGTSGDPTERASLINEIVRSIAVIPDGVTREVYTKECAKQMDVSYDVLSRAVVSAMISVQSPRFAADAEQRAEQAQAAGQTPSAQPKTKGKVVDFPRRKINLLEPLERELVGYLIKYGGEDFLFELSPDNVVSLAVGRTIVDELRSDEIEMSIPVYSLIYNAFAIALDRGVVLSSADLLASQDEGVSQLVADILTSDEQHQMSNIWDRFEMRPQTERELLAVAVPKAIVIYKSKVIESKIAALKDILAADDENFDGEIVEKIKQLNEAKAAMHDRYKRML